MNNYSKSMPWGWRGRGWGRGFCWYLLSQGITKIKIGDQEFPIIPGTGVGRMITMAAISEMTTKAVDTTEKERLDSEIEKLRKEKEELEKRLKELEEKIKELESKAPK